MQTRYLCGLKRVSHAERLPNVARSVRRLFGCGCVKPTFNLPNCTDYNPWQSGILNVGTKGLGNIPNITGRIGYILHDVATATGAFYSSDVYTLPGGGTLSAGITFIDASRSSPVYSNVTRVVPAFICIKYCIKY